METRKIIKLGKSSYVVSLPKNWVQKLNLKEGDVIVLKIEGEELRIFPRKIEVKTPFKKRRINIDTIKNSKLLPSMIRALYKAGYEEIILYSNRILPPWVASAVRNSVNNLYGLEVVYQKPREILLRASIGRARIEELVDKMFSLALGVVEYDLALTKEAGAEYLENFRFIEEDVRKTYALLIRVLNREDYKQVFIVSDALKMLANAAIRAAFMLTLSQKENLDWEGVMRSLNKILSIAQETREAYLGNNVELAERIASDIQEMMASLKIDEVVSLSASFLNLCFRDMLYSCSQIVETVIAEGPAKSS